MRPPLLRAALLLDGAPPRGRRGGAARAAGVRRAGVRGPRDAARRGEEQGIQDGALGARCCAPAPEVLNRLTGQSRPSFRGDQQAVMEHIVVCVHCTFYIALCSAGKSLVLWVLAAWTRRIVVVITLTNALAVSHCTAATTALGGKNCAVVFLRAARATHARGAAGGVDVRRRAARAEGALRLATPTPGRRTCMVNEACRADLSLHCVVPCRQLLQEHGTALNTLSLTLLFASAARARRSLLPCARAALRPRPACCRGTPDRQLLDTRPWRPPTD